MAVQGGAVYIIEGVAGSGKDTLAQQLVEALHPSERQVQVWDESAVLASWVHYYLPNIDSVRLTLAASIAAHIQATLVHDPEAVFVFNRFHVSHAVWRREKRQDTAEFEAQHHRLVAQLHELPVLILHPTLDPAEAASRTQHAERRDVAWERFLERRAADMGFPTPAEMYLDQQRMMAEVMDRDGLPYRILRVQHGQPIDIAGLLSSP